MSVRRSVGRQMLVVSADNVWLSESPTLGNLSPLGWALCLRKKTYRKH